MDYSEIYFAVASVSTIVVGGLVVLILLYVFSILHDIKKLSKIAKKEVEMIARGLEKGASMFGTNLSGETTSFVKMLFAMLLSHFAPKKGRTKKTSVDKS